MTLAYLPTRSGRPSPAAKQIEKQTKSDSQMELNRTEPSQREPSRLQLKRNCTVPWPLVGGADSLLLLLTCKPTPISRTTCLPSVRRGTKISLCNNADTPFALSQRGAGADKRHMERRSARERGLTCGTASAQCLLELMFCH